MMPRALSAMLILSIAATAAGGETAEEQAATTLRRALTAFADAARNGGWPQAWSVGGKISWGQKGVIDNDWITVQPPATPEIGLVYVDAARVLGDDDLLKPALRARDALLALQSPADGFPKEGPVGRRSPTASLDDDVTTGALRFLIALSRATQAPEDRAAVERVGAFLLAAQYEDSGGWPQQHPPPARHYARHITFNDNLMRNVVAGLVDLHELTRDKRYLKAATRAGDCVLRLQGGPGEEIWAQQYDRETLKPTGARPFEPAGYTPNESVGVCDTLITLYLVTDDERFLKPLPKAFAWYDAHRLANGKLARLYEPRTRRPIYGLAQGGATYDASQARAGYGWEGRWRPVRAQRAFERIRAGQRDAVRKEWTPIERKVAVPSADRVAAICDELSADGFWWSKPTERQAAALREAGVSEAQQRVVDAGDFVKNARLLLAFLEDARKNGQ